MPSLFSNSGRTIDQIFSEESSSSSPPPPLYSYWIFNERLRLKNDQLIRRQQSSCHIAFYSFCLCIISGVICVLIYRYTDQCSLEGVISLDCSRHFLFFGAICISCLSCSGLVFGTCQYFRLEPHPIISGHELHRIVNQERSINSDRYSITRVIPTEINDEHSNTTELSSMMIISSQQKIEPLNSSEAFP